MFASALAFLIAVHQPLLIKSFWQVWWPIICQNSAVGKQRILHCKG